MILSLLIQKHTVLFICSSSLLCSSVSLHGFIHKERMHFLLQLFLISLSFLLELLLGFFLSGYLPTRCSLHIGRRLDYLPIDK